MTYRFDIDPTLVADAIGEGRKLVVTVFSPTYRKVTLGDRSPHAQPGAIAKRT